MTTIVSIIIILLGLIGKKTDEQTGKGPRELSRQNDNHEESWQMGGQLTNTDTQLHEAEYKSI